MSSLCFLTLSSTTCSHCSLPLSFSHACLCTASVCRLRASILSFAILAAAGSEVLSAASLTDACRCLRLRLDRQLVTSVTHLRCARLLFLSCQHLSWGPAGEESDSGSDAGKREFPADQGISLAAYPVLDTHINPTGTYSEKVMNLTTIRSAFLLSFGKSGGKRETMFPCSMIRVPGRPSLPIHDSL